MKRILYYILLIILLNSNNLLSQNKEITNIIATANSEFNKKNYYGAAKLYKDALKLNSKMYNIVWHAAESYRLDNDYIEAAKHYRILSDKAADKYPDAVFYYALMLKANEDYSRAQYFFQKYIENNKDEKNILIEKAKKEIFDCEIAWKMMNNPNGYTILQYDTHVNSVYSEFATSLTTDSVLIFSSIRPINDESYNYESKLYTSGLNNPEKTVELFANTININGYDVSNPHINKKGDKIYFTLTDFSEKANTYIYSSDYSNGQWSTPEKLPDMVNFPDCNSTQPFLVERGDKNDILLWSSDKPGGEGGFDIYFCELLPDNTYGTVRNIGRPILDNNAFSGFYDTTSVINTVGNEITPYYNTNDSTLYFSSDWHQNMGGYDIFYVKGDFKTWGTIKNMGYPVNSAQNDFYYKIYPENSIAFLTSNRKSSLALSHQSCCNDIFYHKIEPNITEEDIEEQRIVLITSRTKLLVPITLYFHNDMPSPNSWDTTTNVNYTDTYFEYLNMQEDYRKNYSRGLQNTERVNAIDSIDYFFSYNVQENYNKLLEFTKLMKELLLNGQKIIITIKGYTSPLNTVEYNNNLAKRRIASLVNYINEYENNFFSQFIDNGMLNYEFVAFGKTLSGSNVSDDPNDPRNSIYSPEASRERRIEIIAISVENNTQTTNK